MLAGLSLFDDHFIVERVNDIAGNWVPDQVVMNTAKTIIAINNVWLNHSAVIAAKVARDDPIEGRLDPAFLF